MMVLFAFLIAVSLFNATVRGAYYYIRTVIDETATFTGKHGENFKGGWVDSLGTAYFAKSSILAVQTLSPAGTTSLIIGPSNSSLTGASGPSNSVQLDGLQTITGDTSGNLYICSGYYFIWKYDHSSGIVSRIAGDTPGSYGYSGDGGQATAAKFRTPTGMFYSSNGILFVADTYNYRIRTINTTTGIINTFAGNGTKGSSGDLGPATSATLNGPSSLWGSSDGVIYFVDYGNYRLRQVDASGIITAFAGIGYAGYNGENIPATSAAMRPFSISGDSNGNIFYVDMSKRVRMIQGGKVSTIAGNGKYGSAIREFVSANTSVPSPSYVFTDPVSGAIYYTTYNCASMLVETLPTPAPTNAPTNPPTPSPTNIQTNFPTYAPSFQLTQIPTIVPTSTPTFQLTQIPTIVPTSTPTFKATQIPTIVPTSTPTFKATQIPTIAPTDLSKTPTISPTNTPTKVPSLLPTIIPTISPTNTPSTNPSFRPFSSPTNNKNDSTLNSESHSDDRMSDLHIFYATFFPSFFVLLCMLIAVLVYIFYYKKDEEKEQKQDGNANTNNIGEKGYEKVEGEEGVVVQEKYYKMWL